VNQPAAAAFVRESLMAQPPEGYAGATAKRCRGHHGGPVADRVPNPLITGDEDCTAPPDVGRAMASAILGADFRMLAACGHWPTIERARGQLHADAFFV
jgi:pimeloyl-ACP methyl ester carboxylesterase